MAERTCIIDGCGRAGKLTRGMCAKHYRYWIDHTPVEERPTAPRFIDTFWINVLKTHEYGCWLWTAQTDPKGYGRWKGKWLAHREAWRRENGEIPDGLHVLHICDQHACVNPRHLYIGTVQHNAIDASVRGQVPRVNIDKTHCPAGHPYAGDNLYIVPATGARHCVECNRVRSRERQRRRRAVLREAS